ncbi:MAG TPA: homoserine kinase [Gemmatimonadales bacterium]|jgi:homoserine kinase
MRQTATAFAPGSIGNVGPGLDIVGLAVAGLGDAVTLARREGSDSGIEIIDPGHRDLPRDPARHASAIAAAAVFERAGCCASVTMSVRKGLPLAGGQGGSAASAIAGAVAANHLCEAGLDATALLECGLAAESTVAGRHADNLAPALLGGLVLIRSLDPLDLIRLPVPDRLRIVLVHPAQQLRTSMARAALPEMIAREVVLVQAANIAGMVAGAYLGDLALFGRSVDDRIAEPARRHLLPGFDGAKAAALASGALACSISGAGPTVFALVDDPGVGAKVGSAMVAAYARAGVDARARVDDVDTQGARVCS